MNGSVQLCHFRDQSQIAHPQRDMTAAQLRSKSYDQLTTKDIHEE